MNDFRLGANSYTTRSAFGFANQILGNTSMALSNQHLRFAVTGDDHMKIACVTAYLLAMKQQVVLLPLPLEAVMKSNHYLDSDILLILGEEVVIVPMSHKLDTARTVGGDDEVWDLALFTSGSTQHPRAIGVRNEQLDITASWYRSIYEVGPDSLCASSLPATYNFTFIAGVYLASYMGCTYIATEEPEHWAMLENYASNHDRTILLSNPVVLESLANNGNYLGKSIMIDTGGAPLSSYAIQWHREHTCDLREGYGLTETCSLTHFDAEGSIESLGTVGHQMEGVETSILISDEQKPGIVITSPNIGIQLDALGRPKHGLVTTLHTGDLGQIDAQGRLRLLGRQDDFIVNGFWPRDTLDLIGPTIGAKCALVQHPTPNSIIVRLWSEPYSSISDSVKRQLAETVQISPNSIQVDITNRQGLHSQKIKRL